MKRRVMNGSWELRAGGWGWRWAAQELPSCCFGKGTCLQNKSDRLCAAPGPLVCRGAKAGAGHLPGAQSRMGAGAPGSHCVEGRAGEGPWCYLIIDDKAEMRYMAEEGKAWVVEHSIWSP